MYTDETVERSEEDIEAIEEEILESSWPAPESFEFVGELIEDFDPTLEKRRSQPLQLMRLTWSRSKGRPVF